VPSPVQYDFAIAVCIDDVFVYVDGIIGAASEIVAIYGRARAMAGVESGSGSGTAIVALIAIRVASSS